MIAEHTWGLDVKSHLGNWDKYDFDIFTSSLALPEFMKMEKSWKELDDYIWQAVDILPGELQAEAFDELEKIAGMTVSLINKPKNRLPEAYWLSFVPENIIKVVAEKTGQEIDLGDVVEGGNRQMHGIDRYVDIYTSSGIFRITSPDAFLMAVGERDAFLSFQQSLGN